MSYGRPQLVFADLIIAWDRNSRLPDGAPHFLELRKERSGYSIGRDDEWPQCWAKYPDDAILRFAMRWLSAKDDDVRRAG